MSSGQWFSGWQLLLMKPIEWIEDWKYRRKMAQIKRRAKKFNESYRGDGMIKIKMSTGADTRSAKEIISKEKLFQNSRQHICDVREAILWMCDRLLICGERHDHTKMSYIDEFHEDFKAIQEGRTGDFKQMNWFKNRHLTERHHLTDWCPEDVNLFDVLERVADITMAGMARSGKIYADELSAEILARAYKNTVQLLKDNIEVEP